MYPILHMEKGLLDYFNSFISMHEWINKSIYIVALIRMYTFHICFIWTHLIAYVFFFFFLIE